jgi:hypothetical protein
MNNKEKGKTMKKAISDDLMVIVIKLTDPFVNEPLTTQEVAIARQAIRRHKIQKLINMGLVTDVITFKEWRVCND